MINVTLNEFIQGIKRAAQRKKYGIMQGYELGRSSAPLRKRRRGRPPKPVAIERDEEDTFEVPDSFFENDDTY